MPLNSKGGKRQEVVAKLLSTQKGRRDLRRMVNVILKKRHTTISAEEMSDVSGRIMRAEAEERRKGRMEEEEWRRVSNLYMATAASFVAGIALGAWIAGRKA